jgi:DNA-binding LytR/AlgR family response regulator
LASNVEVIDFVSNRTPDLVISDIQLSDGLCFTALAALPPAVPVIFTTAFDQYVLKAFDLHCIDYLLKPVSRKALQQALDKLESIRAKFSYPEHANLVRSNEILASAATQRISIPKKRFLVYSGKSVVPLEQHELGCFYKSETVIFVIDIHGKQYTTDYRSLDEVYESLDPNHWFRANRQMLIHDIIIHRFEVLDSGKINVFALESTQAYTQISKEKAAEFKRWMEGE